MVVLIKWTFGPQPFFENLPYPIAVYVLFSESHLDLWCVIKTTCLVLEQYKFNGNVVLIFLSFLILDPVMPKVTFKENLFLIKIVIIA